MKRRDQIGFSQRIHLDWLEYTANLVLAGNPRQEIVAALSERLKEKLLIGNEPERGNHDKAITILTKVLGRDPEGTPNAPRRGLDHLRVQGPTERMLVHRCMCMAHPPRLHRLGGADRDGGEGPISRVVSGIPCLGRPGRTQLDRPYLVTVAVWRGSAARSPLVPVRSSPPQCVPSTKYHSPSGPSRPSSSPRETPPPSIHPTPRFAPLPVRASATLAQRARSLRSIGDLPPRTKRGSPARSIQAGHLLRLSCDPVAVALTVVRWYSPATRPC